MMDGYVMGAERWRGEEGSERGRWRSFTHSEVSIKRGCKTAAGKDSGGSSSSEMNLINLILHNSSDFTTAI